MSSKISTQFDDTNTAQWIIAFKTVYQNLSKDNLASLTQVYHQNIVFEDPLHKVEGIDNFITYFDNLYTNVITCTFDITHIIPSSNEAAIYWKMHYQHPKLNSGKTISVTGHSHLKVQDEKIIYHRDYLDVGAMLYEHVPLLGGIVNFLKKRVSQ